MKPASAKAKGRFTEHQAADILRANGVVHAERRARNGAKDRGDITGWPGVVVEVKSGARITPAAWLDELRAEMANAECDTGFVLVRPPRARPVAKDWYGLVPGEVLLELYKEAGWIP